MRLFKPEEKRAIENSSLALLTPIYVFHVHGIKPTKPTYRSLWHTQKMQHYIMTSQRQCRQQEGRKIGAERRVKKTGRDRKEGSPLGGQQEVG